MHPSVHSEKPGACPICGMTLVKRSVVQQATTNDTSSLSTVSLSPRERILANVETTIVRRQTFSKVVNAVGVIDFAEPNLRHITMRFPGRLDHLFLNFTGQKIHQGEAVAAVYSPEAISAQQEFILALNSHDEADSTIMNDPASLMAQSKEKLLLLGFTPQQIEKLRRTRKADNLVTIVSPITGTVVKKYVDPQHYAAVGEVIYDIADLSTVWMNADVYEQDIRFMKIGQSVEITSDAYPGESFSGTVTFIDPVMNSDTRTVRVRTEFVNSDGKLKPNMFVATKVDVTIPHALTLPSSAILITGKRNVVWVESMPNMFEQRNVEIGAAGESEVEILSGVREGETVATSGGFLIDSESSLRTPMSESIHAGHSTPGKN